VEELIVYVENPIERLQSAIAIVEEDLNRMSEGSEEKSQYLKELDNFNRIIASNDLPEFYDPIESDQYRDNLDSYNFSSIFGFMTNPEKRAKFGIRYEGTRPPTQDPTCSTKSSWCGSHASSPKSC
jgi:hypothetical protein